LFNQNEEKNINLIPVFDVLRVEQKVDEYQNLLNFLEENKFEFKGLEFDGYTDMLLNLD